VTNIQLTPWVGTVPGTLTSLLPLLITLHTSSFSSLIATMLGIQELDDLICLQLTRQDLAQCVRVNKKWHSIAVPHLWRDLTSLSESHLPNPSFSRMVIEDYLELQQCQKSLGEGLAMGRDGQPQQSSALSALSKYGPWIRVLPDLKDLQNKFDREIATRQIKVEAEDLILHLFERCPPDVQVNSLLYGYGLLFNDRKKTIIDLAIPHVRRLRIGCISLSSNQEASELIDQLDQCSDALRELELDIDLLGPGRNGVKEEQMKNEPKEWTSLKKLTLHRWNDNIDTNTFWPWAWVFKKCGQVEKLEVYNVGGPTQVLVQAMLTHMPKLTEATLGSNYHWFGPEGDIGIAGLLSGSCKGWRVLDVRSTAHFGITAMNALEKHFPTLESLVIDRSPEFPQDGLTQVLSSCPNLHTLVDAGAFSALDAETFVDQDPDTGLLKPWKCESTLKVLKVTIYVPNPLTIAVVGGDLSQEQELQNLVYDRLARLTKLETLCLDSKVIWGPGFPQMTLESGLHKLSGLARLKELYLSEGTWIGADEVQWMTEHWPRLHSISQLDDGRNIDAVIWSRDNHPEIRVTSDNCHFRLQDE